MRTTIVAGLKPLAALSLDIAAWDSSLLPFLESDVTQISRLVESRGLSVLMIDFPEACKVFDSALSSRFLEWTLLPKVFGKRVPPRKILFECLFDRIFNEDGTIRHDVDPNSVFFLRQLLSMFKKVRMVCSDAAIKDEIDTYRRIDASLRSPTLSWTSDSLSVEGSGVSFLDGYRSSPDMFSHRDACPKPLLEVLGRVCDIVSSAMPQLDWREIEPRHGPGAVADARTGTDKYLFPHWPRKLDRTFPFEYFAQSREDLHIEEDMFRSIHEPPARLLAVPKTLKAPRLIASQPVSHQYLQGGIMRWLRKNLPSHMRLCIDFIDQQKSRDAALVASLDESIATVDLSSASDRLSCWVVERVFRRNPSLLEALHATRTRWLVNATKIDERFFLIFKKFADQGAAITFPVQSIVYACIAIASILYEKGGKITHKTVYSSARRIRVYGDDIIMPSLAVKSLTLLLAHLELKVNMRKTHVKGSFRESCGVDAYAGHIVSPVYLRDLELGQSAESLGSWVDISNNAYHAGLWNLAAWMMSEIPDKVRKLIPISNQELGCVSLRTYQIGLISPKRRFSKTLHRMEILALQVTTKEVRRRRDTHQSLLQFFIEKKDPQDPLSYLTSTKWSSGWTERNRSLLRKRWVPVE